MLSNQKKFVLGIITTLFIFSSVVGAALIAPKPANAFPVEVTNPITIATDIQATRQSLKDKIKEQGLFMLMSSLMNALNYFANKIAYDMGVWLASGDLGQSPFASGKSFGNYLAQVAGDSLGEMLGSLSEQLGLNLCDLPDLRLDLALQLGFHFASEPPTPKCTWQQLRQAYNAENIRSKYASKEALASRIGMGVQVKDSDFGVWLQSREKMDAYTSERMTGASLDRQEGDGIGAFTELISGKQITPATAMKEEVNAQTAANKNKEAKVGTMGMTTAALGKGATTVALNTVKTFINTALSTVVNNFITKGMFPGGYKVCNPGLSITGVGWDQCAENGSDALADSYYSAGAGAGGAGQRRAAQEMFSELLQPKIRTLENYDPTANMAECSEDNLAPDSCIVDQSFLQILQIADSEEPLTIKQALEKGLLHGDWKVYSFYNEAMNQKRDCSQSAYCHRNIRFMRLLRILPLGFEIAAAISPNGTEATLQQIVDGYYNMYSPYYKLVNPYWVLTFPKTKCGALSYSAVGLNGIHLQTCADIQHCVGFNKDGSCSNWGYCLREKPIWKFNANYCDAQYNTCRAFSSADGSSGSYLVRTLDTVSCTAENDGCRRYSKYKFYDTSTRTVWYADAVSFDSSASIFNNSSIFFNKKSSTCDVSDDGCSAYKLSSDTETLLYLKKAPDYLGCYDADPSTASTTLGLLNAKIANGVQWPVNFSDLSLIQPQDKEACKNYAQVCLPEEENCNNYTSVMTSETIPGKFTPAVVESGMVTWNDQCDARCNGYSAYREMPSNYSTGKDIDYIVPSSGRSCASSDAGCSAFTNLNATSGGLSQSEYFSYLRPCILPDQNLQRNYTVYESTEIGGFQIKTYTLVKSDDGNGPKQVYRDADDMEKYAGANDYCSEASYEAGTADPDCHQFIDDQGGTHYAMLSKTVVVSDQCTPYRLNSTELVIYDTEPSPEARCPFDFDNGANNRAGAEVVEYKDNACYYMGYTGNTNGAGNAVACTAQAESCRAYKGNYGNNVHKLVDSNFEGVTTTGWSDSSGVITASLSTESTQLDGHSLKLSALTDSVTDASAKTGLITLTSGKQYMLSFWAKGTLPIDHISIIGSEEFRLSGGFVPSDVWKYYSYGPVEYNPSGPASPLDDLISVAGPLAFFVGDSGGGTTAKPIYIDNIILTEVEDYLYLVKNSMSVNPICDSNPTDNLPGEALGCSAYQDPLNNLFYLTNFSYLCREAAVGCTAVLDTQNTPDDPYARAHNVWLKGSSGAMASTTFEGKKISCQVEGGDDGCYADFLNISNIATLYSLYSAGKVDFNASTVIIPADTTSSEPIYLVANQDATCQSVNMGCQVLGRSTYSASGKTLIVGDSLLTGIETFEEVAVKNDPALYDTTLCEAEANGCKAWTSGDTSYYFKDPLIGGFGVCDYKSESFIAVAPDPVNPYAFSMTSGATGWVWKDIGACTNEAGTFNYGRACNTDADCTIGSLPGLCKYKNQIPCYPAYRDASLNYGLWSFGNTAKYHNMAGNCPAEQSGCSEFIDHSSAGENYKCALSGKLCYADSDCVDFEGDLCVTNDQNAYYLIDDTKFSDAQSKCNGQVSQAEGCVLIDKTSNPNKYWTTTSTYQNSIIAGDALVSPVENSALNDANIIVKVTHDRVCGEWAYCDLKQEYEDEESGEVKNRCFHLGVCNKAGAVDTVAGRVTKECVSPMPSWDTKGEELDIDFYKDQMNGWDSPDFSGYSMDSVYQIADISARPITPVGSDKATYRLVHVYSEYNYDVNDPTGAHQCQDPSDIANTGVSCGTGERVGKCYNGECVTAFWRDSTKVTGSTILTCRAYPEESAPFRDNILVDRLADVLEYKEGYQDSNLCYNNSGNPTDCDYADYCSYRKMSATAGDIYKPITEPVEANYICIGGTNNGHYCTNPNATSTCGEEGICSPIKSTRLMSGWMGYCMESDYRQFVNGTTDRACMTWWPIESPPGVPNYWDTDPNAGFEISEGPQDRFMCLENEPALQESFSTVGLKIGDGGYTSFGANWPKGMSQNNSLVSFISDWSGKIGIQNIPGNAVVMGCSYKNSSNKWDMFYKKGIEGGSVGWYCPVNTANTFIDDASIATCRHGWTTEGCLEHPGWYADDPDHNFWSHDPDRRWFNQNSGKYIKREEIERIDVFLSRDPGTDKLPYGGGYISFITDATNADEGNGDRAFVMTDGGWTKKEGDATYGTASLENLCDDGKNWRAWSWYATYAGSPNWLNQGTDSDGTIPAKEEIAGKGSLMGICDDEPATVSYYDFNDGNLNMGVRIVFDDQYYFRGIWMNIDSEYGSNSADLGFFFVIHLAPGKCQKFAQMSVATSTSEFLAKPYTNALVSDTVAEYSNDKEYISFVAARKSGLNGGKFGLAYTTESNYIDIRDAVTASFINPFLENPRLTDKNISFSQDGGQDYNYGFTGYSGGVPINFAYDARSKYCDGWNDPASCAPTYFEYSLDAMDDTALDGTAGPFEVTLMRHMFAKVYDYFNSSVTGGFDTGYASYYEPVDAANPQTAIKIDNVDIYPPKVAAPTDSGMQINSISVNGTTSGNIYLVSGAQTHIKFYAWAHGNQMPLRRVVADKGDSIDTRVDTGYNDAISNRKLMCGAGGVCDNGVSSVPDYGWQYPCNTNADCPDTEESINCYTTSDSIKQFGNTTDTGCKAKPWDIVADYNCPFGTMEVVQKDQQPDEAITGMPIDWTYIEHNFYDAPYVCVARPKVHVQDNWGWCTGSCVSTNKGNQYNDSDSNPTFYGDGCYGDFSLDHCSVLNTEPWVKYNGYVIVVPVLQ